MLLEDYVCKRYKDSKEFVIRYREKDGVKLYYRGTKMFDVKNNKLTLNASLFVPNHKNVYDVNEETGDSVKLSKFQGIPGCLMKDVEKIEPFFDFCIPSTVNIPYSTGRNYARILEEDVELKTSLSDVLNEFLNSEIRDNYELEFAKKGLNYKLNCTGRKSSFARIYDLMYILIDFKELLERELKGKIKFKSVSFKPDVIMKDSVSSKDSEELDDIFNSIQEVMINRIKIYIGLVESEDDFKQTKMGDAEKQIQQDFMIADNSNIFGSSVVPFEMEYNIYAGEQKIDDEEDEDEIEEISDENEPVNSIFVKNKERKNIKGRIDNVLYDDKTVHLVEVKYGDVVISGTNGLHKHLIDLYTCLKISKAPICSTLKRYISQRNNKLDIHASCDCEKLDYYIICFYDKDGKEGCTEEAVKSKIYSIYHKTGMEIEELQNSLNERDKISDYENIKNLMIEYNLDVNSSMKDLVEVFTNSSKFNSYDGKDKKDEIREEYSSMKTRAANIRFTISKYLLLDDLMNINDVSEISDESERTISQYNIIKGKKHFDLEKMNLKELQEKADRVFRYACRLLKIFGGKEVTIKDLSEQVESLQKELDNKIKDFSLWCELDYLSSKNGDSTIDEIIQSEDRELSETNRYPRKHLELTIPELIEALSKEYGCDVKILLADRPRCVDGTYKVNTFCEYVGE